MLKRIGVAVGVVAVLAVAGSAPAASSSYTVTISITGAGTGAVSSTCTSTCPAPCLSTCTESYPAGMVVTLTPTAASGSRFYGWSNGPCRGSGACTITMNSNQNVTATFVKKNQFAAVITKGAVQIVNAGGGKGYLRARFSFVAIYGTAVGFRCGFAQTGHPIRSVRCVSPATYSHLTGQTSYVFIVYPVKRSGAKGASATQTVTT
jgi:hypothetical protein